MSLADTLPFADPVIREARARFDRVAEWEAAFRPRFINDIKFANGDSENGYQWKESIRRNRDVDNRPCLTMNMIGQHNFQISNAMRQNKSQIKVLATGNSATAQAAKVWSDLIRYVEMTSNAQDVYTVARAFQIDGGRGWWRIVTQYVGPDSFDQDPRILPIIDPLSVYMDPDIQQKDGSDANWAFVFDDVPLDQWEEAYPQYAELGRQPLGVASMDDDWISRDHIRVCEYFRKVYTRDTLISFVHLGERKTIYKSNVPGNAVEALLRAPSTRTRPVERPKIEWFLIAGDKIIDRTTWLGSYIPLIRCVGQEITIEGIYDCWGHTRKSKDAQRMYNWNASAQVEFVSLQGKTPWLAPAKAIEELESMWNTANVANHSVLIYNHIDDTNPDTPIPPPQRLDPPNFSVAYQTAMDTAFNQMMMTSGQWQNQMGMMGNERTGAAIGKRQQQGDVATYHFQDNYEIALRFTGTQLIDLIPKLWDTNRAMMILSEKGEVTELVVDPLAKQALAEQIAADGQVVSRVFNPNVGRYAIAPSVGPAYGSRREEAVEKMGLLLAEAPALVPIVGDLMIGEMDFDGAQEAAQRLFRMVPPQALGKGPTQNEQALGTKNAGLTNALAEALNQNAKASLKLVGKEQMRDIDVAEANTKRLAVLKDFLPASPEELIALIRQTVHETLGDSLGPIITANQDDLDIDPAGNAPVVGATRGADSQWYVPHPDQQGKWLKVEKKKGKAA